MKSRNYNDFYADGSKFATDLDDIGLGKSTNIS